MLYSSNESEARAGVDELHSLAKKHHSDEEKKERILEKFCIYIKKVDVDKPMDMHNVVQEILDKICYEDIYTPENINLVGASLIQKSLQGANLRGAKLQGVDLRDTNLGEVILEAAYLQFTILPPSLQEADLNAAIDLSYAIVPDSIEQHISNTVKVKGKGSVIWHDSAFNRFTHKKDKIININNNYMSIDEFIKKFEIPQDNLEYKDAIRAAVNHINRGRIVSYGINLNI